MIPPESDPWSSAEIEEFLVLGGRAVRFEYCLSMLMVTVRRSSRVHLLRANELGLVKGFWYSVVTLLCGWWGVPWGLLYTPLAVWTNLTGGRDVTDELRASLGSELAAPLEPSGN